MAVLNFNAEAVEPAHPAALIPRGRYLATIVDSEIKPTRNRSGDYLQLTFCILTPGAYCERKLWARLNLRSPNPVVVDIAQRELSALCHALGLQQLRDSVQMHGIPVYIDVGVDRGRDCGEPTNRIRGYFPATPEAPAVQAG